MSTPGQKPAFDPDLLLAIASMDYQAGRFADAQRGCSALLQIRPDDPSALHLLGMTEARLGRVPAALELIGRAVRLAPGRSDVFEALVGTAMELTRLGKSNPAAFAPTRPPVGPDEDRRSVSVVVCSIDDAKHRRVCAHYERLFAHHPCEIVSIRDAKSLCEGYNRGFARSSGEIVIFSHDDIEIASDDFARRLFAHLSSNDVVGIAGASRLNGPSWTSPGQPYLHGCVVHCLQGGRRYNLQCFGPDSSDEPIKVLDGVFIAARRDVCRTITFDEETFDGFHFYDLDFTCRAFAAGFRLAVSLDILLLHESTGAFDAAAWQGYAAKFIRKHEGQISFLSSHPQPKWPSIAFQERADMIAFHGHMLAALRDANS
jgi:hypothetical protein